MTAQISAVLIVKNEAPRLEQCINSFREHVDEVVIVDTGSTDGTQEIAQRLADKFEEFTDCNFEDGTIKDFAMARNRAHSLATHDWHFWVDGDDIVETPERIRQLAETAPPNTFFLLPYHYSFDAAGNCTCIHYRERLVNPGKNFKWVTPVHEVFLPQVEGMQSVQSDAIVVKHTRDTSGKVYDPTRNLRILEPYVNGEGKDDLRAWFYYGLELSRGARFDDALKALEHYTSKSGWCDERCLGYLEMARICLSRQDFEGAEKYGSRAMLTKSWSEPPFILARTFFELALRAPTDQLKRYEYNRCAFWGEFGCNLHKARRDDTILFHNPREYFHIQPFLAAAFGSLGHWDQAIQACEVGLSEMPGEPTLTSNRKSFVAARGVNKMAQLNEELVAEGALPEEHAEVIRQVLSGKIQIKKKFAPPPERKKPVEGKLDIAIHTGAAWEDWDGDTVEQGMGGSETMAWELGKRLVKLGHAVRIYGQPPKEREQEGVQFLRQERLGEGTDCDVLIASRSTAALDLPVEAKVRVLWLHDVHAGQMTPEHMARIDYVLCLSQWHKEYVASFYPRLDPDKIVVTRNGIDLEKWSECST